jgi:hypothetical protein
VNFYKSFVVALCVAVPLPLFADFEYRETTKITGGSVLQMMKFAGALSKESRQMSDPITSTVLVKGNQMARINKDSVEIIDLDKETVTRIDIAKKQYSITTFQQLRQQMEQSMAAASKEQGEKPRSENKQPQMNFKVNVRNTGAAKQVTGLDATESILSMALQSTDNQSGEKGSLAMTNDMWMTPEIPGYTEVNDFNRRWGMKMGAMPAVGLSPSLGAMPPGTSQGMAEMAKEMSKVKGVPILQIMRVGSTLDGQPLPAASEAPLPASASTMPSAGDVAKDSATTAATSTAASKMGGFGGLVGGLGGLGHKKKKQEQPAESSNADAPATSVLMESSTELTTFSSAAIDASRFGIPVGYKQVQPESGVRSH